MFEIKREKVTWVHPTDSRGRQKITHPIFANVYVNGEVVHSASTVTAARRWALANCKESTGATVELLPVKR